MNVLITGAHGFIGKNLQANLDLMPEIRVLAFTATDTIEHLRKLLAKADIVVHLAGINRPSNPSEFETGNAEFTRILCNEIEKTGRNISVVLTSSIHAVLENPYGKSKKAAEEAVFSYARRTGAAVYVYRLPGVFGKWCKPNYKSVV